MFPECQSIAEITVVMPEIRKNSGTLLNGNMACLLN
jgi:hypothetical protein